MDKSKQQAEENWLQRESGWINDSCKRRNNTIANHRCRPKVQHPTDAIPLLSASPPPTRHFPRAPIRIKRVQKPKLCLVIPEDQLATRTPPSAIFIPLFVFVLLIRLIILLTLVHLSPQHPHHLAQHLRNITRIRQPPQLLHLLQKHAPLPSSHSAISRLSPSLVPSKISIIPSPMSHSARPISSLTSYPKVPELRHTVFAIFLNVSSPDLLVAKLAVSAAAVSTISSKASEISSKTWEDIS
ncbi:uncharacterized protein EI97DRAFT_457177 [Westerdykella ornata]|uniref:Uncharacterized protein n=1 Tax=Westerdykella ornata TaxID=318751 RepID=A0A6A6JMR3_WESOR|nr:uncharacterized protein EI97DRAFT_457177 [Westerdykella ornata]KAF2277940.1 hypothetical protein EI97DRAFT_457177 [Westerdykella ornata]